MTPLTLTITPAQAQMIARAEQAKAAAIRDAELIVSAICAGHMPDGAQLTNIDVDTNTLTFHVPPKADDAG